MVIKKAAKIGMNFLIVASVGGEALPTTHEHHMSKDGKHYQDFEKPEFVKGKGAGSKAPEKPEGPGEKPEVPPHSRRIESRVQATEDEIEQSIGAKGQHRGNQRDGRGNEGRDPFEGGRETRTSSRRREQAFEL